MTREKQLGNGIALLGFAAIAVATLRPGPANVPPAPWTCLVCGTFGGADVLANVLLFVPYGVGLGLIGGRRWRAFALVVATTCMVELLQYRVLVGRDGTISDVITNSLGGALGIAIGGWWAALVLPRPRASGVLAVLAAGCWTVVLAAAAVAMMPSYHPAGAAVAFAPVFPPSPPFRGRVLAARVGSAAVVPGQTLPNDVSDEPRLDATIVAAGPVEGQAPIVWVGHDPQEELLLAQRGDGLAFRARLRAADWKLKVPAVGIDHVVGGAGALGVHADLSAHVLTLGVDRDGASPVSVAIRLSPTLGWVLLAPSAVIPNAWYRWLTALWVGGLLFPTGYWGTRAIQDPDGAAPPARDRAATVLAWTSALIAIGAGLVAVPLASLHALAHWSEWLGACAGLGVGGAVAIAIQRTARHADARNARASADVVTGADHPLATRPRAT